MKHKGNKGGNIPFIFMPCGTTVYLGTGQLHPQTRETRTALCPGGLAEGQERPLALNGCSPECLYTAHWELQIS